MLGPTAAGKSDLAVTIAEHVGGEVLSVDSMQVYRGMDIGTAKPDADLRQRLPHHLIDLADPADVFTVAEFQRVGRRTLAALDDRGVVPVIAGGSGLHFRALVDPLEFPPSDAGLRTELEAMDPEDLVGELLAVDPVAGEVVDLANPRRVLRAVEIHRLTGATPSSRAATPQALAVREYRSVVPFVALGVDPGDGLRPRVIARFDAMLTAGLLDEVARLLPSLGPTARQAVGYKELIPVVEGAVDLASGRWAAIQATFALAKRQRTYFRRDPRIRWLPWHDDAEERLATALRAVEEAAAWTS